MNIRNAVSATKFYLSKYGVVKTVKKIFKSLYNRIFRKQSFFYQNERYKNWIKSNEPTQEELEQQRKKVFKITPKFSVVVPMYNTPRKYLEELADCLINQTYDNWELCLADGSPEKNEEINAIIKKDARIAYKFLNENKGISGNTNEALKIANGDFIALLDHDDLLPTFCLYELTKTINENPEVEFIYTDVRRVLYRRIR